MSTSSALPHPLEVLLGRLIEQDGTDLYIAVGSQPMASVKGHLMALGMDLLSPERVAEICAPILTGERAAAFAARPDLDTAYVLPRGKGRFRVNVFRQRGELGLVARRVHTEVPTVESLRLPHVLKQMALLKQGLILVTGATGSGKSTTLAAMIDHRNESMPGHIVTIEDPIEFIHPHKRCVVSQREVGSDTLSYADGLRSALRQAPGLVLVGEIRDLETAEAALHMAETGHLVLTTLHATNASQAIERVASLFPAESRERVHMLLGLSLGGVISQRLVRTQDGGRAAAIEVLVPTARVRDLVGRGAIDALRQAMLEASGNDGMQTFEEALAALVAAGRVAPEEAIAHADSPADLRLRLRQEAERQGRRPPVKGAGIRML